MPKNGEQASKLFLRIAFLDQPAKTRVIESYPDGICFDAKVSDNSRRWRNENRECIK